MPTPGGATANHHMADPSSKDAVARPPNKNAAPQKNMQRLLSAMQEEQLYDTLRPFLRRENMFNQREDWVRGVIRHETLKSMARKWRLHLSEAGFWKRHTDRKTLALALHAHIVNWTRYFESRQHESDSVQWQTAIEGPMGICHWGNDPSRVPPVGPYQQTMATAVMLQQSTMGTPEEGKQSKGRVQRTGKASKLQEQKEDSSIIFPPIRHGQSNVLHGEVHPYKGDLFGTRGEYSDSILYQSRAGVGGKYLPRSVSQNETQEQLMSSESKRMNSTLSDDQPDMHSVNEFFDTDMELGDDTTVVSEHQQSSLSGHNTTGNQFFFGSSHMTSVTSPERTTVRMALSPRVHATVRVNGPLDESLQRRRASISLVPEAFSEVSSIGSDDEFKEELNESVRRRIQKKQVGTEVPTTLDIFADDSSDSAIDYDDYQAAVLQLDDSASQLPTPKRESPSTSNQNSQPVLVHRASMSNTQRQGREILREHDRKAKRQMDKVRRRASFDAQTVLGLNRPLNNPSSQPVQNTASMEELMSALARLNTSVSPNAMSPSLLPGAQHNLRKQCATALRELSRHPKNRRRILNEGAFAALVNVLHDCGPRSSTSLDCVGAFFYLSATQGLVATRFNVDIQPNVPGEALARSAVMLLRSSFVPRPLKGTTNCLDMVNEMAHRMAYRNTRVVLRTLRHLYQAETLPDEEASDVPDLEDDELCDYGISTLTTSVVSSLCNVAMTAHGDVRVLLAACLYNLSCYIPNRPIMAIPNLLNCIFLLLRPVALDRYETAGAKRAAAADALVLTFGIRCLSNLATCSEGRRLLLQTGAISKLARQWFWMSPRLQMTVASRIIEPLAREYQHLVQVAEDGGIWMLRDCIAMIYSRWKHRVHYNNRTGEPKCEMTDSDGVGFGEGAPAREETSDDEEAVLDSEERAKQQQAFDEEDHELDEESQNNTAQEEDTANLQDDAFRRNQMILPVDFQLVLDSWVLRRCLRALARLCHVRQGVVRMVRGYGAAALSEGLHLIIGSPLGYNLEKFLLQRLPDTFIDVYETHNLMKGHNESYETNSAGYTAQVQAKLTGLSLVADILNNLRTPRILHKSAVSLCRLMWHADYPLAVLQGTASAVAAVLDSVRRSASTTDDDESETQKPSTRGDGKNQSSDRVIPRMRMDWLDTRVASLALQALCDMFADERTALIAEKCGAVAALARFAIMITPQHLMPIELQRFQSVISNSNQTSGTSLRNRNTTNSRQLLIRAQSKSALHSLRSRPDLLRQAQEERAQDPVIEPVQVADFHRCAVLCAMALYNATCHSKVALQLIHGIHEVDRPTGARNSLGGAEELNTWQAPTNVTTSKRPVSNGVLAFYHLLNAGINAAEFVPNFDPLAAMADQHQSELHRSPSSKSLLTGINTRGRDTGAILSRALYGLYTGRFDLAQDMLLPSGYVSPLPCPNIYRMISFAIGALKNLSTLDYESAMLESMHTLNSSTMTNSSEDTMSIRSRLVRSGILRVTIRTLEPLCAKQSANEITRPLTSATDESVTRLTPVDEMHGTDEEQDTQQETNNATLQENSWYLPLPIVSDAITILDNLSIEPMCRQAIIAAGALTHLVPGALNDTDSVMNVSLTSYLSQLEKLRDIFTNDSIGNDTQETKVTKYDSVQAQASANELYSLQRAATAYDLTGDTALQNNAAYQNKLNKNDHTIPGKREQIISSGSRRVDKMALFSPHFLPRLRQILSEMIRRCQQHCAMCLCNLATDVARSRNFHCEGVMRALVALVSFEASHDPIRVRIASAFRTLAGTSSTVCESMVRDGVVPVLVRLCSNADDAVRRHAAAALYYISRADKQFEQALLDSNTVPALLTTALIRSHDAVVQTLCIEAVYNVLANPDTRSEGLKAGVIWALQRLCTSPDSEVQRACAVTLLRLSSEPVLREIVVQQGGIRSVVSVLLGRSEGDKEWLKVANEQWYDSAMNFIRAAGGDTEPDERTQQIVEATLDELDFAGSVPRAIRRVLAQYASLTLAVMSETSSNSHIRGYSAQGLQTMDDERRRQVIENLVLPLKNRTEQKIGVSDPVVGTLFAGVIANVSKGSGNELRLAKEGAVEALSMLIDMGESKDEDGQESKTNENNWSSTASSQISRLRPSCALGLYNLSRSLDYRVQEYVTNEGGAKVFVRLGISVEESVATRKLCALGLCHLLWNTSSDQDILKIVDHGATRVFTTILGSRQVDTGLEIPTEVQQKYAQLSSQFSTADRYAALCALHYLSAPFGGPVFQQNRPISLGDTSQSLASPTGTNQMNPTNATTAQLVELPSEQKRHIWDRIINEGALSACLQIIHLFNRQIGGLRKQISAKQARATLLIYIANVAMAVATIANLSGSRKAYKILSAQEGVGLTDIVTALHNAHRLLVKLQAEAKEESIKAKIQISVATTDAVGFSRKSGLIVEYLQLIADDLAFILARASTHRGLVRPLFQTKALAVCAQVMLSEHLLLKTRIRLAFFLRNLSTSEMAEEFFEIANSGSTDASTTPNASPIRQKPVPLLENLVRASTTATVAYIKRLKEGIRARLSQAYLGKTAETNLTSDTLIANDMSIAAFVEFGSEGIHQETAPAQLFGICETEEMESFSFRPPIMEENQTKPEFGPVTHLPLPELFYLPVINSNHHSHSSNGPYETSPRAASVATANKSFCFGNTGGLNSMMSESGSMVGSSSKHVTTTPMIQTTLLPVCSMQQLHTIAKMSTDRHTNNERNVESSNATVYSNYSPFRHQKKTISEQDVEFVCDELTRIAFLFVSNCAETLVNLSYMPRLREELIHHGAAAALISVSRHTATPKSLKTSCLRALCEIAIDADGNQDIDVTRGMTEAGLLNSPGFRNAFESAQNSFQRTSKGVSLESKERVVKEGAVSALIAIMKERDTIKSSAQTTRRPSMVSATASMIPNRQNMNETTGLNNELTDASGADERILSTYTRSTAVAAEPLYELLPFRAMLPRVNMDDDTLYCATSVDLWKRSSIFLHTRTSETESKVEHEDSTVSEKDTTEIDDNNEKLSLQCSINVCDSRAHGPPPACVQAALNTAEDKILLRDADEPNNLSFVWEASQMASEPTKKPWPKIQRKIDDRVLPKFIQRPQLDIEDQHELGWTSNPSEAVLTAYTGTTRDSELYSYFTRVAGDLARAIRPLKTSTSRQQKTNVVSTSIGNAGEQDNKAVANQDEESGAIPPHSLSTIYHTRSAATSGHGDSDANTAIEATDFLDLECDLADSDSEDDIVGTEEDEEDDKSDNFYSSNRRRLAKKESSRSFYGARSIDEQSGVRTYYYSQDASDLCFPFVADAECVTSLLEEDPQAVVPQDEISAKKMYEVGSPYGTLADLSVRENLTDWQSILEKSGIRYEFVQVNSQLNMYFTAASLAFQEEATPITTPTAENTIIDVEKPTSRRGSRHQRRVTDSAIDVSSHGLSALEILGISSSAAHIAPRKIKLALDAFNNVAAPICSESNEHDHVSQLWRFKAIAEAGLDVQSIALARECVLVTSRSHFLQRGLQLSVCELRQSLSADKVYNRVLHGQNSQTTLRHDPSIRSDAMHGSHQHHNSLQDVIYEEEPQSIQVQEEMIKDNKNDVYERLYRGYLNTRGPNKPNESLETTTKTENEEGPTPEEISMNAAQRLYDARLGRNYSAYGSSSEKKQSDASGNLSPNVKRRNLRFAYGTAPLPAKPSSKHRKQLFKAGPRPSGSPIQRGGRTGTRMARNTLAQSNHPSGQSKNKTQSNKQDANKDSSVPSKDEKPIIQSDREMRSDSQQSLGYRQNQSPASPNQSDDGMFHSVSQPHFGELYRDMSKASYKSAIASQGGAQSLQSLPPNSELDETPSASQKDTEQSSSKKQTEKSSSASSTEETEATGTDAPTDSQSTLAGRQRLQGFAPKLAQINWDDVMADPPRRQKIATLLHGCEIYDSDDLKKCDIDATLQRALAAVLEAEGGTENSTHDSQTGASATSEDTESTRTSIPVGQKKQAASHHPTDSQTSITTNASTKNDKSTALSSESETSTEISNTDSSNSSSASSATSKSDKNQSEDSSTKDFAASTHEQQPSAAQDDKSQQKDGSIAENNQKADSKMIDNNSQAKNQLRTSQTEEETKVSDSGSETEITEVTNETETETTMTEDGTETGITETTAEMETRLQKRFDQFLPQLNKLDWPTIYADESRKKRLLALLASCGIEEEDDVNGPITVNASSEIKQNLLSLLSQ